MQEEGNKKESSWEVIREWFRLQKGLSAGNNFSVPLYGSIPVKRQDLRLLLGVLGCPLAPIPLVNDPIHRIHIKNTPIENSAAHYIIQQYLAATGCLKQQKCMKNMYSTGSVKMIRCETEISSGKNVKSLGTRSGENGCFVLWQMLPGMWSLELVVGENKVIAGSDGKTVWRHTPWLGTHAAKGPQRPLRRIIQVRTDKYFVFLLVEDDKTRSGTLFFTLQYIFNLLLIEFNYIPDIRIEMEEQNKFSLKKI
ncbi:hypothetical protein OIU84_019574 [Salix udensis]|uniref:Uncharacterized protein n=1 Tax=Salix udensis TaxID=889485 RepID=A0AAD6PL56_9ROSI|nr:hypothetical protein OIU84_019574 [Salix udensis]